MTFALKRLATSLALTSGILLTAGCSSIGTSTSTGADTVFMGGPIYTLDKTNRVVEALAIKNGAIIGVGSKQEVNKLIDSNTSIVDLDGKTLMPGLVDAHMHPMAGGEQLNTCSLNYAPLSVDQVLAKITTCVEESSEKDPSRWLKVGGWYRQAMTPEGADLTAKILDRIPTDRPIYVFGSDFHSLVTNTAALKAAGINKSTPSPEGGSIEKDAKGNPTGIFLDSAMWALASHVPPLPEEEEKQKNLNDMHMAVKAISAQGVTTILDAAASESSISAFSQLAEQGQLNVRANLAPNFGPERLEEPEGIVAEVKGFADTFNLQNTATQPGIQVNTVKVFMDGVIQAPAQTGAMMAPYLHNTGSSSNPAWSDSDNDGELYVSEETLSNAMIAFSDAGFNVHMHTDGDRAVHTALNSLETLKANRPDSTLRPALAHCEVMVPEDYARITKLNALPVISFQWGKPAQDTIDTVKNYMGEERFNYVETAGKFKQANATIVYGSDWPVDALNEWFAMEVALTRMNENATEPKYQGRLGDDPGLDIQTVLRAFTINAAYSLNMEDKVGSLEVGKYADMIIIDRDLLNIPSDQVSETQVLKTYLGGREVYTAPM
ncbi:hydrolase [Marinomonas sp. CT5]|uniref:amidohydrolase n=1 Tax=Marinomonas sp. CT5 TaxID=2066133 RepID=UPI001BAE9AD1|nr:amidohydrolase [Marinomonas sp. CT5]QUX95104.1 hydrolase [Marinomonas sp. CT5]